MYKFNISSQTSNQNVNQYKKTTTWFNIAKLAPIKSPQYLKDISVSIKSKTKIKFPHSL